MQTFAVEAGTAALGMVAIALHRVRPQDLAEFEDALAIAQGRLVVVRLADEARSREDLAAALTTLARMPGLNPHRVLVDGAEEHTVAPILEAGCWAGLAVQAGAAMSPQRACDVVEVFGLERVCLTAEGGPGPHSPLTTAAVIHELRRRGHAEALIRQLLYENPLSYLSQLPALARRA